MRVKLTFAVLAAAALALVGAAQAVSPGKNGAIYFESFNEATQSSDIYAINPSGAGLRAVTKSQTTDEADPAVSPNGRLVAFVSDAGGGAFHLRLSSSNGSGERALAGGGVAQAAPAWSPNGKLIAFSRCLALDPDGGDCTNAQIAVIGSNGKGVKVLTKRVAGAVDSRPSWAPSGKQLVFQRMNAAGVVSLWTVSATGKSARRIVNDGSAIDHSPAYAPNGKTLVYYAEVGTHEAVWQVDSRGHGKKQLFSETPDPDDASTGSGTENPAISPNGKLIVYTAGGELWTAALDGKNRKQLTQNGGDEADWARG